MNDAIILVFFLNDVIELPCKFMEIATENSIATPILFVVGSAPVHKKWNVARCDKTIDKLLLTIPIYYHFKLPRSLFAAHNIIPSFPLAISWILVGKHSPIMERINGSRAHRLQQRAVL